MIAECDNCGMTNVPIQKGHCYGCICQRCGATAIDAGGSMSEMGWCEDCEEELASQSEQLDDLGRHL